MTDDELVALWDKIPATCFPTSIRTNDRDLIAFARAVMTRTVERCAEACEERAAQDARDQVITSAATTARVCAARIRAIGAGRG